MPFGHLYQDSNLGANSCPDIVFFCITLSLYFRLLIKISCPDIYKGNVACLDVVLG